MSLLRQDMLLPESSIHDFGRDLVISIQYLHSNAIIYCDLKPSNILLDENGRIKLGGFGLSRRLSDINKTSLQQLPPVGTSSEYCKKCMSSHCLCSTMQTHHCLFLHCWLACMCQCSMHCNCATFHSSYGTALQSCEGLLSKQYFMPFACLQPIPCWPLCTCCVYYTYVGHQSSHTARTAHDDYIYHIRACHCSLPHFGPTPHGVCTVL